MSQLAPNGGSSGPGAGYASAAYPRSPRIGSVLISSPPAAHPAGPYGPFHGPVDDEHADWATLLQREDVNVAGFGARRFARHQHMWRELQTKRAQQSSLPPMNGSVTPPPLGHGLKGPDQQSSARMPPAQMYQAGSHAPAGSPIPVPNSAPVSVPEALLPTTASAVVSPPSALAVSVARPPHRGGAGSLPSSGSDGGVSTPSPTRISPTSNSYDTPMKISELRHQRLVQQRAADRNDSVGTPPWALTLSSSPSSAYSISDDESDAHHHDNITFGLDALTMSDDTSDVMTAPHRRETEATISTRPTPPAAAPARSATVPSVPMSMTERQCNECLTSLD